MQLVELINKSDEAPYYLKQNAVLWKTSIQDWMKEKNQKNRSTKDILRKSETLVKQGTSYQEDSSDRGGEIYFLRALSDLHLILAGALEKPELGEALYLTGRSYEAVKDLSIWTLHENYYESCIRSVPHSDWSGKCYKRLEESILLGYTGSAGVSIPPDVQSRLEEYKKLAL